MSILDDYKNLIPVQYEASWKSPANIAFVKYWGKKGHQIPANPSLSMTMKECMTETKVLFTESPELSVELFLEGVAEEKFALKIKKYLESLSLELAWLKNVSCRIETKNTFPHGTGIASSASGLSAFALALTDYIYKLKQADVDAHFFKTASFLARLASGSACRSVYGGFNAWGESELAGSSDLFATPLEVHAEFEHLKDTVLVISGKEKSVSSRAGHGLMQEHDFSLARYSQAKKNFSRMLSALKRGEVQDVGIILENEALGLHAMMMTSPESYFLLKPNSLTAMEMVRDFRDQTKLPLYFTLDAGPNLHLIYPEEHKHKIRTFISHELTPLTERIIHDERGEGPVKC